MLLDEYETCILDEWLEELRALWRPQYDPVQLRRPSEAVIWASVRHPTPRCSVTCGVSRRAVTWVASTGPANDTALDHATAP